MKNLVLLFMISILTFTGCHSQEQYQFTDEESVLDFYRQHSLYTDPGEYVYLYENLPDSLPELLKLLRSQFIHPYAELPKYQDIIPKQRWNEMMNYSTVESILEGLVSYNPAGIADDRKPEHRLVLGCRDYAVLLASILRHRGIPARLRAGHATYIMPDFHISHIICEVWNKNDNRWMLVDPDMGWIDFSRDKFDFSNEAWVQLQNNEIDPDQYGIPGKYTGTISILGKVTGDLEMIMGNEITVYNYSPMLDYAFKNNFQVKDEHKEIIDKISELMKELDANNLSKLQEIYNGTPEIQNTKSFIDQLNKNTEERDKTTTNTQSIKPDIEFVDIPGGTFIMGSPDEEEGREDDEIQHEVTVSSFQMSKYCVTIEQYNKFCEVTDRKKPWYGGNNSGILPVSQVSWNDANAFAEWMGCRLPTEAEFEYAARANTTTPFYTGDCITTDQANFNGKEPYTTCDKGELRKKALPVGSFPPNAFGLYDMHGNIWQWTNDWYGEYNTGDTLNPQGPETGTLKVDRGGGFYDPAHRCRSACRGGGTPPGNRGSGLSFRLVKDH